MKYEKLVKDIVKNIGGKENIVSVSHCVTRLRFKLKDKTLTNKKNLEKLDGIITILESGGQFQVVIGNHVPDVYTELASAYGLGDVVVTDAPVENQKILDKFIDIVSNVFQPILSVLCAAGMIKGFNALFMALGLYSMQSGTYTILNAIGDSLFYFFPIFLGYTAAKKLGLKPFVGMAIGASLVHPSIVGAMGIEPMYTLFEGTMVAAPVRLTFAGLPVVVMNYTSSVVPIIFATFFAAKIEKKFNQIIPDVVKSFVVPFFTLLIAVPLALVIVGPITTLVSQILGGGILAVLEFSPVGAGLVLGGLWQVMVIFGLHWGVVPAMIYNIMTYGYDNILALIFAASFAQIGVVLAIMLKTKDKKLKALCIPAFISGIFGVTEPAIYGITLPRKKPFIISCIAASIGGGVAGMMGAKVFMMGGLGIFTIPTAISPGDGITTGFWGLILSGVVGFALGFAMMYMSKLDEEVAEIEDVEELNSENMEIEYNVINAPMAGNVIRLSDVSDQAFAKASLGKGIAIEPTEGKVIAPASGTLTTFFNTGHALGITTDSGVEILIHVGMDTVQLEGKHFTPKAKQGDVIKKGDLLLEFDIENIKKAGFEITTPIVITNTFKYADVISVDKETIKFGDDLLTIMK